MPNNLEKVFEKYKSIYVNIFQKLYPAKNDTGFTERNLSVNFSKAYESINEKSITWFEFQFGGNNDSHADAIVFDEEIKTLFVIESKRFNNPNQKIADMKNDALRINQVVEEILSDSSNSRINKENFQNYFGIILADVWSDNSKTKERIYKEFLEKTFEKEFLQSKCGFSEIEYKVLEFNDIKSLKDLNYYEKLENYKLLSIVFRVNIKSKN